MAMTMGRARATRAGLGVGFLLVGMLLIPGGAAAAAPAGFSLSPGTVSLNAVIGSSDTQVVTVTTGRKPVALEVEFFNGQYADDHTGTCTTTYAMQVPADTSCTISVSFTPFTAGAYPTDMTVSQCLKWQVVAGTVQCDRVHASVTITLDGVAVNAP